MICVITDPIKEIDRQIDDRQIVKQTDKQLYIQMDRQIFIQIDRQIDRLVDEYIDGIDGWIDGLINIQMDGQMG